MTVKYKHVMVDIEALGKHLCSPILSIGAVFFDPMRNEIGPRFYEKITLESAMRYGAMPDASTIIYWLKQSSDARSEIIDATETLKAVLMKLQAFLTANCESRKDLRVWANGPTYDVINLESAFVSCGLEIPWVYYRIRDVRTAVEFGRWDDFNPKYDFSFEGTPHKAVDDAAHQARYVSAIISRLFTAKGEDPTDCIPLPPAPATQQEWTNEQCLEFLSVAFRHANINGDIEFDDIRLGVKMANAVAQGKEG